MGNSDSSCKLWLNQALGDLLWTKSNLKEQVWYGACFTAQQSVEKILKAYLDSEFEIFKEECATLTDYYAPARYPDIGEFMHFSKGDADQAYEYAEKVVKFTHQKII